MKKAIILISAFLLMSMAVEAQSYQNVLKTNPLGLAFGNFNVTYERVISNTSSVQGNVSYWYSLFGADINVFGFGAAYRYYITNAKIEVPSGFYVNPQVGFSFGGSDGANVSVFRLGAEIGYQWAWPSGFVLDLGIGPNFTSVGGDTGDIDFDRTSGVLPSATLAIGYAF